MKMFKITYVRHGNVADYTHTEDIKAVSAKMAIKKFWNKKGYGGRTTREAMEYERECCGIWWSQPTAEEVEI